MAQNYNPALREISSPILYRGSNQFLRDFVQKEIFEKPVKTADDLIDLSRKVGSLMVIMDKTTEEYKEIWKIQMYLVSEISNHMESISFVEKVLTLMLSSKEN